MNENKQTQDFIKYAHSFQTVTRPGLERIAYMLDLLNHPEDKVSCIHVAGTNGKGSVTAFLDAILSADGYKVGRYTSPNLVRVNERLKYCGSDIADEEMQSLFEEISKIALQAEKDLHGDKPTQFEIWTAAAFLWFSRKQCDYVILETGMGGEFDATNVISHNVTAVLTRIDLDHTEYLGNSIEEITKTKCGIIKENSAMKTVFTTEQEPTCLSVIRKEAERKGNECLCVSPLSSLGHRSIYEICDIDGLAVQLGIGGLHQKENASLAVAVAQKLGVSKNALIRGLQEARHPARMEVLREKPLVLYDGAHNPNGVRALCQSLKRAEKQKFTVIFACMKDKEIDESLVLLKDIAEHFIFTTVRNNSRAETSDALTERARASGIEGETAPSLRDALRLAEGEDCLICGSLYLYADLPEYLRK